MATHSLRDVLAFSTDGGESLLPPECALIVLTSTLATSPSFIAHHFLHQLLSGTKPGSAVFLSFLNGASRLTASMKKLGVDLLQAQQRQKFIYVDAFSQLFLSVPGVQTTTPTLTLNSRSAWGTQLAQTIVNAVRRVDFEFDKPALFIEGLDFLLAVAGEEVTTDEILTLVSSLSECTSRIFISLFADDNLLDSANSTPLAQNQSILLTSLVHRAHSVISLRPLQTGTAKDVIGILRLTRGGGWYDLNTTSAQDSDETQEWEMLYRLEDGRAKLFKHA